MKFRKKTKMGSHQDKNCQNTGQKWKGKEKTSISPTTWMDLKGITLSEKKHILKGGLSHDSTYMLLLFSH